MVKLYAVKFGRVPGVYRTWPEAKAQTNGFPGAVHASFHRLDIAVEFSGIPLDQQPQWVREALGVPDPAPVNPIPAAGPPPPYSPTPSYGSLTAGSRPSSTPNMTELASPPLQSTPAHVYGRNQPIEPIGSLINNLRSVSVVSPSATTQSNVHFGTATLPQCIHPLPNRDEGRVNVNHSLRSPLVMRDSRGQLRGSGTPGAPPTISPFTSPTRSQEQTRGSIPPRVNDISLSPRNQVLWAEDSILSGIFHRQVPSAASSESTSNDSNDSASSSSFEHRIDPMEPIPEGLYGARDTFPNMFYFALRSARCDTTCYSPHLSLLLGQHAVNYMLLHYFSAGSTMVVANAFLRFQDDAQGFVEHLAAEGMPPRRAAYLWTIISPETMDNLDIILSLISPPQTGGQAGCAGERQEEEGAVNVGSDGQGRGEASVDSPPSNTHSISNNAETNRSSGGLDERDHADGMDIDIEYIDFPDDDENARQ
ncbi:hypothetical protein FS837_011948 [Tulasnella sp. UAMH 9824]|nr:hypothetical protein FS837_011948 [Tulasnella sp. UAMH 9824]